MPAEKPGDPASKTPPHSDEAERAVLGSLLLDSHSLSRAMELVKEEHFYSTAHRKIYRALLELDRRGCPADMLTLAETLGPTDLDSVGGKAYLARLYDSIGTSAHLDHYARIVAQKALLRELVAAGSAIVERAFYDNTDPESLLDEVQQSLFELGRRGMRQKVVSMEEIAHQTVQQIDLATKGQVLGLKTGFVDLDKMIGGLRAGELVLVGGRTSMGKTAFALDIARYVALIQKQPVFIVSLEMTQVQIGYRMICAEANVSMAKAQQGFLQKPERQAVALAAGRFAEAPIYVEDSGATSVAQIRSRARRLKEEHGLALVIVDYIQMIAGRTGRSEYRQQDVAEISRQLKATAKDLDLPVLALAQLSRAAEGRERKSAEPRLSDLRESGALEQDADVVILLYRPAYYEREDPTLQGIANVNVAKNRNGRTGPFELNFEQERARFTNRAQRPEEVVPR